MTLSLLESQNNDPIEEIDGIKLYKPENLYNKIGVEAAEAKQTLKLMKTMVEQSQLQIEQLERHKERLNEEINSIYATFQNHAYHLHSIFVHEGTDNSGHYYVYIRDPRTNLYKKFSDIHVTEATNEDVWKDSLGEIKTRAAYCLFYVNEDTWQSMVQSTTQSYYIPKTVTDNQDTYNQLVPAPIAKEINDQNLILINEIVTEKAKKNASKIKDMFKKRVKRSEENLTKVDNMIQSISSMFQYGITIQENKPITRRWLLDLVVRETFDLKGEPFGSGLQLLKNDESIFDILKQGFLDKDPVAP